MTRPLYPTNQQTYLNEGDFLSRVEHAYCTRLTEEQRHDLVQYAIAQGYFYSAVRSRFAELILEVTQIKIPVLMHISGLLDQLILDEVRVFDPAARWVYVPKEEGG